MPVSKRAKKNQKGTRHYPLTNANSISGAGKNRAWHHAHRDILPDILLRVDHEIDHLRRLYRMVHCHSCSASDYTHVCKKNADMNEVVREYTDTKIHDRTEDYYLGKREGGMPENEPVRPAGFL